MSFLAPLYIAGLAAIALPLVFHLIRRTPRGQTAFSSLMFLTPSPPRITRRSRLDQWLLLLLRALALALLALAFARPFLRDAAQLGLDAAAGQNVAILVDASASMRRTDLWRQAQDRVAAVIKELRPDDRVAVYAFDADVKPLLDFDDASAIDARRRAALVQSRLAEMGPTWAASDLGSALAVAADRLESLDRGQTSQAEAARRLVLVSDFPQGARLDALQSYEWPADVELEVHQVAPANPTNAGLHLVGSAWAEDGDASSPESDRSQNAAAESSAANPSYRLRVSNAADSTAEQFEIAWVDERGETVGRRLKTYVPPGQSRVVSMPIVAESADVRLRLRGDAHEFDNTLFVAPPQREEFAVSYFGDDAADDPQGCRYYVERALPNDPRHTVRVTAPGPNEPLAAPGETPPRLAIVAGNIDASRQDELRRYLERGGRVIYVALEANAGLLPQLLDEPSLQVLEAPAGDYALLGSVDFSHPIFVPFADPRFSDFTKVHFWRHRKMSWASQAETGQAGDVRILAHFDNRDPALLERQLGRGVLYVLASSWRPVDSQLARSSKFVPLLMGMLGLEAAAPVQAHYVNQPLQLPPFAAGQTHVLKKPDGSETTLSADAVDFQQTDQPGVYRLGEHRFCVQLDPAESDTAPRAVEELEQFGVRLTGEAQRQAAAQRQRHRRDVELEARQKIWRWLLAAALVLIVVETWWAGRQSRLPAS